MIGWLQHWLGFQAGDGNSAPYLFWSGIVGDLALLGAVGLIWRRFNCHVKGCPRVGLRKVPEDDHVVCHKHHPEPSPTHAELVEAHRRGIPVHALRRQRPTSHADDHSDGATA